MRLALLSLLALASFAHADTSATPAAPRGYAYHSTEVLGTSLDLAVLAPTKADADKAHAATLAEIERLRKLLSTYDPASEISRLNATTEPMPVSPELMELLSAYQTWNRRTANAHNPQLGDLIKLYKQAEQDRTLPTVAQLAPVVQALTQPAFVLDSAKGTARRLTPNALNVDSLGKAYIIAHAVAAARQSAPIAGIMLNIGGDIATWSDPKLNPPPAWKVAVTDPANPAENAAAVTELAVRSAAVATSGSYARYYTIAGKRYSHILDPRTGKPAEGVASATVIARDNVTANALATTLCVLPPAEGLKLVSTVDGAAALIIADNGQQFRSPAFKAYEAARDLRPVATSQKAPAVANAWPKGHQLTLETKILPVGRKRNGKPFTYVWITDADGKHVKTLALYGGVGKEWKYAKDMRTWWQSVGKDDQAFFKTLTRATRPAGAYSFTWDGTDQKGNPVATGTYTVNLEVAFEDGPHAVKSAKIACDKAPATAKMDKAVAFEESTLTYGPGK